MSTSQPGVHDSRRRRPPETTLRWAATAIGRGSRVVSVRRLTEGSWHANHALTIVDHAGKAHRLVLRRWAQPDWDVDDPDMTTQREAVTLRVLADSSVPAPRLVAADVDGETCEVPTLLLTRLPGSTPGTVSSIDLFLAQLAETLAVIHAVDGPVHERVPPYRRYVPAEALSPPPGASDPRLWARAIELARTAEPPGIRGFIHRDYHPWNTLWRRGLLTGVVDWTSASFGPAAVDVGHMRWNLALAYGLDVAEEFLRRYRAHGHDTSGDQAYWDVVALLDVWSELKPDDLSVFELTRLEPYLASTLTSVP